MKRSLIVSVIFLVTLSFVMTAEGAEKTFPLSIGTHPVGSFFNTIGTAAAKVISEHTGTRAIPKPMAGPVAWFPYMETGEIELGVLNNWDAEKGYLGEDSYEKLSNKKGFSARLLAITIWNSYAFVVAKDSNIHQISDLKGRKVSGNYPTPSLQLLTESYLANANLSWRDVVPVPANSVVEGTKLIIDGRSDASGLALGTGIIEELNAKRGARYLFLNPEKDAVERTKKFFPGYLLKVAPGPANTGVEKEGYVWAFDIYLIVGEKVPDETVYNVTKALWENYKDFENVHTSLKDWTPDRFVSKEALVPYHAGAIKFYKEKGVWKEEMAKLQEDLLNKKKK